MSEQIGDGSVNRHYLDKVMDLAEEMEIQATEDIFDTRGMKLIAKGARISRALQEKLILHKLCKPLESSIRVEGGVDTRLVSAEAQRIAENVEAMSYVLQVADGRGASPFEIMSRLAFGNAMSMMLTIIERGGAKAFEHCVMVSLTSVCLARKMNLGEEDQQIIALAGLLHDIGELYIEPQYLRTGTSLLPHEWRHVVVHPRVGQMLIEELENCPTAVAQAVSEHHERFDGTGYPRQIGGQQISMAGQILSVAEIVSGIFLRPEMSLERAKLALAIIPGQYARPLVSAISEATRLCRQDESSARDASSDVSEKWERSLFSRIAAILNAAAELNQSGKLASRRAKNLLSQALQRVHIVQRAFVSTGLDVYLDGNMDFREVQNSRLLFEAAVATQEIQWRLRDIARDLALQAQTLDASEVAAFESLVRMLDHE